MNDTSIFFNGSTSESLPIVIAAFIFSCPPDCVLFSVASTCPAINVSAIVSERTPLQSRTKKAYNDRNKPEQLLFHSDQDAQYTARAFQKLFCMNEVVQSFSISGRTYDNAVAESFSASMKREGIYRTKYKSERQFMESIDTYIEFYNTKRHIARSITKRQSSLNRALCK